MVWNTTMSLMEISKSITQNLDRIIPKEIKFYQKMIPKNPGIAQKGTQKSRSNPQKSTQNNGTYPYRDTCKLQITEFTDQKSSMTAQLRCIYSAMATCLLFLPINSLICWCKSGNEHSLPHMANLFLAI